MFIPIAPVAPVGATDEAAARQTGRKGIVFVKLHATIVALAALAATTMGGAPPADRPAAPPVAPPVVFTDVSGSTGLDFTHVIGATGKLYFPEIMGSGCALFDYDNDGDLDVYLPQGLLLDGSASVKDLLFPLEVPMPPTGRLYRNDLIRDGKPTGRLVFVDVTAASGAGVAAYGMGVASGDYDNDGDVDLYLTNFGPDVLLRNNGDGTFTDVAAAAGLGDPRWDSSATFFDYDRDGWLDLFVVAYADFTVATHKECYAPSGARDYCNPKVYPPLPCRLYHNRGDGTFENVTAGTGIDTAYGHALGVVAADFDGDGWVDIYVANDGDANQLWMNRRGTFSDTAMLSGAALDEYGKVEAGMGIAAADYDDDGDVDIFLTHLNGQTNTLLENRGDAVFEDVTVLHGLGLPSLRFTSFGVAWADFDQDADLDLFIGSGDVYRVEALAKGVYPYHQTNQLMIDERGRYVDRTADAGEVMKLSEVSRGVAVGDIDNDGDPDVLLSNNNGPARLLRNDHAPGENWLLLRVIDKARKRDAYGARLRLTLSDGRVLTRWVGTDGSYQSARDPRIHFAWPDGVKMKSLDLTLPGGAPQPLKGIAPGTITTVER